MSYLLSWLALGLVIGGWDIFREWDRDRFGLLLPLVTLVVVSVIWPGYLVWKFHYSEKEQ